MAHGTQQHPLEAVEAAAADDQTQDPSTPTTIVGGSAVACSGFRTITTGHAACAATGTAMLPLVINSPIEDSRRDPSTTRAAPAPGRTQPSRAYRRPGSRTVPDPGADPRPTSGHDRAPSARRCGRYRSTSATAWSCPGRGRHPPASPARAPGEAADRDEHRRTGSPSGSARCPSASAARMRVGAASRCFAGRGVVPSWVPGGTSRASCARGPSRAWPLGPVNGFPLERR